MTKIYNLSDIKILNVELNNICNLKCPLCQRNNIEMVPFLKHKEYLDMNILLSTIDKFEHVSEIYLMGNLSEPTLYPNFLKLIKELKKRNKNITISTNGNPYSETFWEELGKSLTSYDTCIFAIDGSTQEKYEQYRINGKLQKVLDNYKSFARTTKAKKVIQTIKFPWLEKDINKEFKELRILLNEQSPIYNFEKRPLLNHSTDDVQTEEDKILNRFYTKMIEKNKTKEKPSIDCFSLATKNLFINYLGDIVPCCYTQEELLLNRNDLIPNIYQEDSKLRSNFQHFFNDWYENKIFVKATCLEVCSNKLKYFRR